MPELDQERLARLVSQLKRAVGESALARDFGPWSLGCSQYPESATNSRLLIRTAQRLDYAVTYRESDPDSLSTA